MSVIVAGDGLRGTAHHSVATMRSAVWRGRRPAWVAAAGAVVVVLAVALGFSLARMGDTTSTIETSAPPVDPAAAARVQRALGVYAGFGVDGVTRLAEIEDELGRSLEFVDLNIGFLSWDDFIGSTRGNYLHDGSFGTRTDVTTAVTVPLRLSSEQRETEAQGGPARIRAGLQDVADGHHDDEYRELGDRLVSSGHPHAIIRLGPEQDIAWYPWSIRNGNEDVYISAFRHVVEVLRSVPGNRFLIDYQGNGSFDESYTSPRTGITEPYGDAAYPGDDVVDIIGVDVYNRGGWDRVQRELDYAEDLAVRHGKPMSIPEWGLWVPETGDDAAFVQNMYDWMLTTPADGPGSLRYHSYFWFYDEADLDQAPEAKARFLQLFGEPGDVPTATT